MYEKYDAVIIGGGPSGLNSARKLALEGLKVAVLERKNKIGKNVICTGIIGRDAFQHFGLNTNSILEDLKEVRLKSPFNNFLTYNHPSRFACVVDREKFDNNLANEAEVYGADIFLENSVQDIRVNKKNVEIIAGGTNQSIQKYQAKIAIIATGIDTRLNKKLGLGYPKRFINGIQTEIDTGIRVPPTIMVGRDVAPGAFAWMVPAGSTRVRIGLITEADPRVYFRKLICNLYPEITSRLKIESSQFKSIAQGLLSRTFQDRVIVVGEAAGQVKTTTGGGIYYGLFCSDIACRIILKQFTKDTFSSLYLSDYERQWKKAIQRELRIGLFTRKFCSHLTDKEVEELFQIARSNGVFPLIRKNGNFDWQSDLILALLKKAPFLLRRMKLNYFLSRNS